MLVSNLKLIKSLIVIRRSFSKLPARKVVVSAIQPTGPVHLGNYFGAIKLWLQLQQDDTRSCVFSIADLHSITLPHDPIMLKSNIMTLAATLLSTGIDPDKCIFFQQSKVSQHTYLSWILLSLLSFGKLSHLPQYKEKSMHLKEIPLTLLIYPVLQSSDIILYKANEIPVGEDQLPHLHVARDLVEKFNRIYGEVFPRPKPFLPEDKFACRVRSLRNPESKMSKSEPTVKGRIDITDPPEVIKERIVRAITDGTSRVTYEPTNRPGVSNLISIHRLCTGKSVEQICEEAEHLSTGEYKFVLADIVIEYFKPVRLKYLELLKDEQYVRNILVKGQLRASEIAEETMKDVELRIGLACP